MTRGPRDMRYGARHHAARQTHRRTTEEGDRGGKGRRKDTEGRSDVPVPEEHSFSHGTSINGGVVVSSCDFLAIRHTTKGLATSKYGQIRSYV